MTTAIFPSYSYNIFLPVNHSKSTASKAFVAFLHNMLSQPPHSFVIILTITTFTTYRVLFAPLKCLSKVFSQLNSLQNDAQLNHAVGVFECCNSLSLDRCYLLANAFKHMLHLCFQKTFIRIKEQFLLHFYHLFNPIYSNI